MKTIKYDLSVQEKIRLKQSGIKISGLAGFAPDEISALLNIDEQRANELFGLITFQGIPSIGPKFAQDLVSLGYYTMDDLLDKDGPTLFNALERKQGFWTDPCVEDQVWLAIHYAKHRGTNKKWWDFTPERKAYRAKHGYPPDRPVTAWFEAGVKAENRQQEGEFV